MVETNERSSLENVSEGNLATGRALPGNELTDEVISECRNPYHFEGNNLRPRSIAKHLTSQSWEEKGASKGSKITYTAEMDRRNSLENASKPESNFATGRTNALPKYELTGEVMNECHNSYYFDGNNLGPWSIANLTSQSWEEKCVPKGSEIAFMVETDERNSSENASKLECNSATGCIDENNGSEKSKRSRARRIKRKTKVARAKRFAVSPGGIVSATDT